MPGRRLLPRLCLDEMDALSQFPRLSPARRTELRGWALLAVGALAIAGVLALLLALSRTPRVGTWLPWGETFFYRALITHVVLSFELWFLAVLGGLSALAAGDGGRSPLGIIGVVAATAGALVLLVPALADQGEPSLNNYVPVLDHPLFWAGLWLHGAGVALAVLRLVPLLFRAATPALFGIACAGLIYLAACLCIAIAYALIPAGTDSALFNERLFWGGGHVLQLLNTALLMVCWQVLSELEYGHGPLPPSVSRAAFAALVIFALAAPLLYARTDVLGLAHRQAFTDLLWYGLPLPPLVMGAGLAARLLRGPLDWRSPACLSLILSLAVFAVGGVAGFFLGVADTRTPSHYHAVIGGVNLGLMGLFFAVILPLLGKEGAARATTRLTFLLFGGGQLVHAVGFFLAGAAGVPRKIAGAAQGLDTLWKQIAMGAVGLGGAVAVIGGVIFVWVVLRRLLARTEGQHG